MTTYNSYEEAKIAMPQACIIEDTDSGLFFGMPTREGTTLSDGSRFAEPQYYCMTVERFLVDGNKFVDGDWFINSGGLVVNVGRGTLSVAVANAKQRGDSRSYILRAAALGEKKPRTKVEYVKVTDSIFDLRPDFEAGELFSKVNHARDYSTINNTQTLARALHQSCCYRRIETPMTEREAFIAEFAAQRGEFIKLDCSIDFCEYLADSGKFKLVN